MPSWLFLKYLCITQAALTTLSTFSTLISNGFRKTRKRDAQNTKSTFYCLSRTRNSIVKNFVFNISCNTFFLDKVSLHFLIMEMPRPLQRRMVTDFQNEVAIILVAEVAKFVCSFFWPTHCSQKHWHR